MQAHGHSETAWTFPGYFPPGENRIHPAFYDKFGRGAKPWILPHPDEIRAQSQTYASNEIPSSSLFVCNGVAVKWGPRVTTSEAISMMTIDTYIGRDCPVPKVYGWYVEPTEDRESETQTVPCTFIYMEAIPGETLGKRQSTLKPQELKYITRQLRRAVTALRSVTPAQTSFIGSIDHKALLDDILAQHWNDVSTEAGPFSTVAAFHDWFASIASVRFDLPADTPIRKRKDLPRDDTPIVSTHGKLTADKIIITAPGDGPARLAGIVDWSQAGFYPAYWECWKARLSRDEIEVRNRWFEDIVAEITAPFNAPEPGLDFFYNIAVRKRVQEHP